MTAPAQQQAPPQQTAAAIDAVLALEAATVLLQAVTVTGAVLLLLPKFSRAGIPRPALTVAVDVVMGMPPDRTGVSGAATHAISRLNLMRRAQFLVSSARRVTTDLRDGRSRGESISSILSESLTRERRYYGQHLNAIWNRMEAAARVDSTAMLYGTVLDSHTSADCRAADRHNFYADSVPVIGYPGMVHPHCRCWPGAPYSGAAILPSTRSMRKVAA
jgi:hypothetical protein